MSLNSAVVSVGRDRRIPDIRRETSGVLRYLQPGAPLTMKVGTVTMWREPEADLDVKFVEERAAISLSRWQARRVAGLGPS